MRIGSFVIAGLAAVVSACSGAGAAPSASSVPPSASPSVAALAGRAFLSTAVTQAGSPKALVPGTRIRIGFEATTLTAEAGCNTMSGAYAIAGGVLRLEQLAITEMACDPARSAQDEWLATFLTSRPSLVASATALTLDGGSTMIAFVSDEIAEPDPPLVGTTWRLESLFQGDTVSSVSTVTATLAFGADGRLTVDTGCNTGSAAYQVVGTGPGVDVGQIALTRRGCPDPAREVELLMLGVLGDANLAYTIRGPVLELRTNGFGLGLRDASAITR